MATSRLFRPAGYDQAAQLIIFIMINIINRLEIFYNSQQYSQIDYIIRKNQTLIQYPDYQAFLLARSQCVVPSH